MCAPSLSCCSAWPKPQQCNLSLSSSQNLREDPGLLLNLLCFLYSDNYTTQCQIKLILNNAFKPALILMNITNTPGIIVICCMFAPQICDVSIGQSSLQDALDLSSKVFSLTLNMTKVTQRRLSWLKSTEFNITTILPSSPREDWAGLKVQSSIPQQCYYCQPVRKAVIINQRNCHIAVRWGLDNFSSAKKKLFR